jgi:hypothetical protein
VLRRDAGARARASPRRSSVARAFREFGWASVVALGVTLATGEAIGLVVVLAASLTTIGMRVVSPIAGSAGSRAASSGRPASSSRPRCSGSWRSSPGSSGRGSVEEVGELEAGDVLVVARQASFSNAALLVEWSDAILGAEPEMLASAGTSRERALVERLPDARPHRVAVVEPLAAGGDGEAIRELVARDAREALPLRALRAAASDVVLVSPSRSSGGR